MAPNHFKYPSPGCELTLLLSENVSKSSNELDYIAHCAAPGLNIKVLSFNNDCLHISYPDRVTSGAHWPAIYGIVVIPAQARN